MLFLYREVLARPIEWVDDIERASRPVRLPVVFTSEEVRAVLDHLRAEAWLMASLLYGSGLRLMECVRLRVKDVDFARLQITVREGKGNKDRVTMLPPSLTEPQRRQLWRAQALHEADLREGFGRVYLPHALARKYPNAGVQTTMIYTHVHNKGGKGVKSPPEPWPRRALPQAVHAWNGA